MADSRQAVCTIESRPRHFICLYGRACEPWGNKKHQLAYNRRLRILRSVLPPDIAVTIRNAEACEGEDEADEVTED